VRISVSTVELSATTLSSFLSSILPLISQIVIATAMPAEVSQDLYFLMFPKFISVVAW
jgi:hypothetical protein